MHYFDAHTHLNSEKLFGNYQHYIDNFVEKGGKALVNVGADHNYNINALAIAHENNNPNCEIYSALGLHPCEVHTWQESYSFFDQSNLLVEFIKFRDLVLAHRDEIVAIGECGIDLHYINTSENLVFQKLLFTLQLQFARELNLPVVIHSRDAFDETFEILKDYSDLKIYFHCWGYTPVEFQKLSEFLPNLWIGFTGNVTYPKAKDIRSTLSLVAIDNILLETDAPYLSPQKVRGKTNEPSFIQYIYQFVAEELMVSEANLIEQIKKNFEQFYSV